MHNKRNLSEVGVYTQWEGPTWEMPMHRGINMHWEESIQIGMSLSGRGGGGGSKHSGRSLSERWLCTEESICSGRSL